MALFSAGSYDKSFAQGGYDQIYTDTGSGQDIDFGTGEWHDKLIELAPLFVVALLIFLDRKR